MTIQFPNHKGKESTPLDSQLQIAAIRAAFGFENNLEPVKYVCAMERVSTRDRSLVWLEACDEKKYKYNIVSRDGKPVNVTKLRENIGKRSGIDFGRNAEAYLLAYDCGESYMRQVNGAVFIDELEGKAFLVEIPYTNTMEYPKDAEPVPFSTDEDGLVQGFINTDSNLFPIPSITKNEYASLIRGDVVKSSDGSVMMFAGEPKSLIICREFEYVKADVEGEALEWLAAVAGGNQCNLSVGDLSLVVSTPDINNRDKSVVAHYSKVLDRLSA